MPISSYLDGEQFDPETQRIMGLAFELTRAALRLSNQDDIPPDIIAKKVIELAKGGECDPERICDYALANFRCCMTLILMVSRFLEHCSRPGRCPLLGLSSKPDFLYMRPEAHGTPRSHSRNLLFNLQIGQVNCVRMSEAR
jgi:hypothetical protein